MSYLTDIFPEIPRCVNLIVFISKNRTKWFWFASERASDINTWMTVFYAYRYLVFYLRFFYLLFYRRFFTSYSHYQKQGAKILNAHSYLNILIADLKSSLICLHLTVKGKFSRVRVKAVLHVIGFTLFLLYITLFLCIEILTCLYMQHLPLFI